MSTLMQASNQWRSRPDDERFVNLDDMLMHFEMVRAQSRGAVVSSRALTAVPTEDNNVVVTGPQGVPFNPTHWSFGQLCQRSNTPAGYFRESNLPAPVVADCINWGLKHDRDVEEIGVLLQANGRNTLRAVTGPNYGRVWNADILATLTRKFGNGIDRGGDAPGHWRVPGEFGKAVTIDKANTTLYASDRDFFVFLADEHNRVEVPGRRPLSYGNQTGTMARGFFCWNSEVGSQTLGVSTFLFDYVCCNRIVWGAQGVQTIKVRHTSGAPDRWIEEIGPALLTYARSSTQGVTDAIANARANRISGDGLDTFLAARFGKSRVEPIKAVHLLEEQRPMENIWDVVTGATAYAKSIAHQDARVAVERQAGALLDLKAIPLAA